MLLSFPGRNQECLQLDKPVSLTYKESAIYVLGQVGNDYIL